MNTNFKVIGLTGLGIKPKSTAPEADALTTLPSELLKMLVNNRKMLVSNLIILHIDYCNALCYGLPDCLL